MITEQNIKNNSVHQSCGKIQFLKQTDRGVQGTCENAFFRIRVLNQGIFKVHISLQEGFDDHSYATVHNGIKEEFTLEESDSAYHILTEQIECVINKNPFHINFLTIDGKIINQDDEKFATSWLGEQVTTYKKLQDGERFVGLGEKTGPLDRKGHGYQNWNTDHFGYPPDSDPLYCSTPFYIGLHHELAYGIYLDNSHKTHFNFGASNRRFSSFSADQGDMSYYFIHEESVAEVISSYTYLTGRMEMPPLWSLGYQQCRYSYKPDKEVLSIAKLFREKEIPADVIVLDIHYMDNYKIFTWDNEDFPNPKAMIDKLKEMGFKVVVICDPGIKVEAGYEAYESGLAEDIFVKYPDGENYEGQVWPGWCHFPDFTSEKARAWWAEKLQTYTSIGIEGLWNDMNEIATWGQYLPELIEFDFEGNRASARKARNVYGMQMARATYEGAKQNLPNKRIFNLTRAGFSGVQRYAAVWTGDNVADDEHMLLGVRLVNSLGLTGIAFSGYDIGGFAGDADSQLFARWISIGAFAPFFRGHSMINSRDSEPWAYGEEVEEISRNYINLRYRMMPYIYGAFYEAHKTGIPVARSLAIDYAFDDKIYNGLYENQYLFGQNILVAPVASSVSLAKVYLPEGSWYDMFTDQFYEGGQEIIAECPIARLPVYAKASSIVVMQDKVESLQHNDNDTLEIHIYNGEETSLYTYYEDDGESFSHQNGDFYKRTIKFDGSNQKIALSEKEGKYSTKYSKIRFLFHGFTVEQINTLQINEESKSVKKHDYTFIEQISNFDPLPDNDHMEFKIHDLATCEIQNTDHAFEISWK